MKWESQSLVVDKSNTFYILSFHFILIAIREMLGKQTKIPKKSLNNPWHFIIDR